MCTLREMVNIIVSTKVNNIWVMLVILIIFDVNKSHVTILSDLCIVAVAAVERFAHGAIGRRIDPSWGGPIELFLVPASAPRLV